jgi:hypothetical protein
MSGECREALARGEVPWWSGGHNRNINIADVFRRPSLEERDKLYRESKRQDVDWKKEGF